MNFIFLTRASRPANLPAVKDSIRSAFSARHHTYQHIVLADLGGNRSEEDFAHLEDRDTVVRFVREKPADDPYLAGAMDSVLSGLDAPGDSFVYVLDDDNALSPRFPDIAPFCTADAVVFKITGHPDWGLCQNGGASYLGKIDWANYAVRLSVMRILKIFRTGECSQLCDGVFFDRLIRHKCSVRFLNSEHAFYNYLSKP